MKNETETGYGEKFWENEELDVQENLRDEKKPKKKVRKKRDEKCSRFVYLNLFFFLFLSFL